jgi:hypothetical protein
LAVIDTKSTGHSSGLAGRMPGEAIPDAAAFMDLFEVG